MVPEAAFGSPAGCIPGGVLRGKLSGIRDERSVLDDERNTEAESRGWSQLPISFFSVSSEIR